MAVAWAEGAAEPLLDSAEVDLLRGRCGEVRAELETIHHELELVESWLHESLTLEESERRQGEYQSVARPGPEYWIG